MNFAKIELSATDSLRLPVILAKYSDATTFMFKYLQPHDVRKTISLYCVLNGTKMNRINRIYSIYYVKP